jgi:hypothetical protein
MLSPAEQRRIELAFRRGVAHGQRLAAGAGARTFSASPPGAFLQGVGFWLDQLRDAHSHGDQATVDGLLAELRGDRGQETFAAGAEHHDGVYTDALGRRYRVSGGKRVPLGEDGAGGGDQDRPAGESARPSPGVTADHLLGSLKDEHSAELAKPGVVDRVKKAAVAVHDVLFQSLMKLSPGIQAAAEAALDTPEDMQRFCYNPSALGTHHQTHDFIQDNLGISTHLFCSLVPKIAAAVWVKGRKAAGFAAAGDEALAAALADVFARLNDALGFRALVQDPVEILKRLQAEGGKGSTETFAAGSDPTGQWAPDVGANLYAAMLALQSRGHADLARQLGLWAHHDPETAAAAVRSLGRGQESLSAFFSVAFATFAGWDEGKHPRDDAGRFVASKEITAAARDPEKAAALRAKVTDPEQRKRLDAAIESRAKGEAGPHHATVGKWNRELDRTAARQKLEAALKDPGRLQPEHVEELARHVASLSRDEARAKLQELTGARHGGRVKAEIVQGLIDHVRAEAEYGQGKEQTLREAIGEHVRDNPGVSAAELRDRFGRGAQHDPADPESHPVNRALKHLAEAGQVNTGWSAKDREPAYTAAAAPKRDPWERLEEGDPAAARRAQIEGGLNRHQVPEPPPSGADTPPADAHVPEAPRYQTKAEQQWGKPPGSEQPPETGHELPSFEMLDQPPAAKGPAKPFDRAADAVKKAQARATRKTSPAHPAVAALADAHKGAKGPAKDILAAELSNIGKSQDPKLISRRIASAHQQAHEAGADPKDIAAIERAAQAHGMERIGQKGERVKFDPEVHQSSHPAREGDAHEVITPGWVHKPKDGGPDYLPAPAETRPVPPPPQREEKRPSHVDAEKRALLDRQRQDAAKEPSPSVDPADFHRRLDARDKSTKNSEANSLARTAAGLSPEQATAALKAIGMRPEPGEDPRRTLARSIVDRQGAKLRAGMAYRPGSKEDKELEPIRDEPLTTVDDLLGPATPRQTQKTKPREEPPPRPKEPPAGPPQTDAGKQAAGIYDRAATATDADIESAKKSLQGLPPDELRRVAEAMGHYGPVTAKDLVGRIVERRGAAIRAGLIHRPK